MDKKVMVEKLKEAKEKAKKRKFTQTIDLAINFKGIDFKKQENRINVDITLPKGKGKQNKIAIISSGDITLMAKEIADKVFDEKELDNYTDKKQIKKIAKQFDVFLAEPRLMAKVGKLWGQVLGPKGKMPKPMPPMPNKEAMQAFVSRFRNVVTLKTKGKFLPVLHAPIGTEEMNEEDVADNAIFILNEVKKKLSNPENQIKSIYVKTTMGPAVKVI